MEPRPRNLEKSEAVPPIQTRKTRLEGLVRKEPLCVRVELISRRSVGPRGAEALCGEIGRKPPPEATARGTGPGLCSTAQPRATAGVRPQGSWLKCMKTRKCGRRSY